jgi:hypothetical protein
MFAAFLWSEGRAKSARGKRPQQRPAHAGSESPDSRGLGVDKRVGSSSR